MGSIERQGIWNELELGNPWWPLNRPDRDDVLSWRHVAAILLRDVAPRPIFAALPLLFEAMYDQTADAVCVQLSGAEDRLTWTRWHGVWLEHFDTWNDPVRQLVEQHCDDDDAKRLAQMLTRLNGASFCDFVLDAYERCILTPVDIGLSTVELPLPLVQPFGAAWPFERLAYGLYERFCAEIDHEPESAPDPLSDLDFNRAGQPHIVPGGDS